MRGPGGQIDRKVLQRVIELQHLPAQAIPQIELPIEILPAIERLPAKK